MSNKAAIKCAQAERDKSIKARDRYMDGRTDQELSDSDREVLKSHEKSIARANKKYKELLEKDTHKK